MTGVQTCALPISIYLPRKPEPVYHSTRIEVYAQSQEVLRTLNYSDPEDFSIVDARLAKRIIEEYQNA